MNLSCSEFAFRLLKINTSFRKVSLQIKGIQQTHIKMTSYQRRCDVGNLLRTKVLDSNVHLLGRCFLYV